MNTERRWAGVGPTNFTADGLDTGIITVEDTACYKVKMKVVVFSDTLQETALVINKVLSRTQMKLGPAGGKITDHTDMSTFLLADNAQIRSVADQDRSNIPPADYERAVYSEEPTMAKRVINVNKYGEENSPENPVYTQLSDGAIEIGTVNAEVEVQLSHRDNYPDAGDVADSVQVGDGANIAKVDAKNKSFSVNRYEKLLPILANAKWLELVNYEASSIASVGDVDTISYFKNGQVIAKAIFTFETDQIWDFKLESYINDDNGDTLLDDDNTPLFLD